MADKDFIVKNGIVANIFFAANGSQISLSSINSTSNGFLATSTIITIGNSTVNSIITPTTFSGKSTDSDKLGGVLPSGYLTTSGTAADSSKLGSVVASSYVNTTGTYAISGVHTYSANIVIANPAGISVNSSYGTAGQFLTSNGTSAYWSSQKLLPNTSGGSGAIQLNDAGTLGSNVSFKYDQTSNTLTIGNSSVSATINSTAYTGSANSATYFGGQLAAAYTNSNQLTSNLSNYTTSSALSTLLGGYLTTTGTAADSSKLGGTAAANYVANSGNYTIGGTITFNNAVIHSGNVTISNSITANNAEQGSVGQVLTSGGANKNVYWSTTPNTAAQFSWTNTHIFSNSVTHSGVILSTNSISANGRYGDAGQVLVSGGALNNVYWGPVPTANTEGGAGSIQYYNGTNFGSAAGLSFAATGNTLSVSNTITLGTGGTTATINATAYSGKAAMITIKATNSVDGYLSATDWATFNSKQNALSAANGSALGYLTAADWTTFNNKQAALSAATSSVSGYLTSTDWTTFNSKQNALSAANSTSLGYLSSADWNTFNGKQAALSAATGSVSGYLTSTDWTTFNNKQATLAAANSTASGYLTFTDWNTFNGKQATLAAATSSVPGYLTAADWTTFNGKQAALGFTPYNSTNPSGYITSSALTSYAPIASATFTANTTVDRLIATKYQVTKIDNGASGTIDCSTGNYFMVASSGAVTFAFNNPPVSTYAYSMIIKATITGTITWPVSVKWPSATSPIKSTGIDTWVFLTDDGGSTWRGNLVMKDNR